MEDPSNTNLNIIDNSNLSTREFSFDEESFLSIKGEDKKNLSSLQRIYLSNQNSCFSFSLLNKNNKIYILLFLFDENSDTVLIKEHFIFGISAKKLLPLSSASSTINLINKNCKLTLTLFNKKYFLTLEYPSNKKNILVKIELFMLNKVFFNYFAKLTRNKWVTTYEQFNLSVNGYVQYGDETYFFNKGAYGSYLYSKGKFLSNHKIMTFTYSGLIESYLVSININNMYSNMISFDNFISIDNTIIKLDNVEMKLEKQDGYTFYIFVDTQAHFLLKFKAVSKYKLNNRHLVSNLKLNLIYGLFDIVFKYKGKNITKTNIKGCIHV